MQCTALLLLFQSKNYNLFLFHRDRKVCQCTLFACVAHITQAQCSLVYEEWTQLLREIAHTEKTIILAWQDTGLKFLFVLHNVMPTLDSGWRSKQLKSSAWTVSWIALTPINSVKWLWKAHTQKKTSIDKHCYLFSKYCQWLARLGRILKTHVVFFLDLFL